MIKRRLYPKTSRLGMEDVNVIVTEKLDGSNLTFFKHPADGSLGIGQRNYIYYLEDIDKKNIKQGMYKGLHEWLHTYGEDLKDSMHHGSAIVGEWLGMGQIKYNDVFEERFHMFAKANMDNKGDLYKINYNHDLFIYPFIDQEIPEYIGKVIIFDELGVFPRKDELDELYSQITERLDRDLEGFCVSDGTVVKKYVRLKDGKFQEHRG